MEFGDCLTNVGSYLLWFLVGQSKDEDGAIMKNLRKRKNAKLEKLRPVESEAESEPSDAEDAIPIHKLGEGIEEPRTEDSEFVEHEAKEKGMDSEDSEDGDNEGSESEDDLVK